MGSKIVTIDGDDVLVERTDDGYRSEQIAEVDVPCLRAESTSSIEGYGAIIPLSSDFTVVPKDGGDESYTIYFDEADDLSSMEDWSGEDWGRDVNGYERGADVSDLSIVTRTVIEDVISE